MTLSQREMIQSLNNGSTFLPVLLLFPHPTNHACSLEVFCMFVQFFCSYAAEVHCSVEWQHGGVIVCLYSGGTSLVKLKSGHLGSSLQHVVVQMVERVRHVEY